MGESAVDIAECGMSVKCGGCRRVGMGVECGVWAQRDHILVVHLFFRI